MFTKSQAKQLAKYIWDRDDNWSNKLKKLVIGEKQDKSGIFTAINVLNFDEACRKGLIRFDVEEIDDNCGLPCFLIFPEDNTEYIDSFSIMIDCHDEYSVLERYKVRYFEIANCLFNILNGASIAEIGKCTYSCCGSDTISDFYTNTSLMFSINSVLEEEDIENPFINYAIYNEHIAKRIQAEIYKVLPCLHVTDKFQLSLEEMIEDAYFSVTEDAINPHKMGRKCWITCTWDFLVHETLYIGIFNTEDKREVEILSDYVKTALDNYSLDQTGKTLLYYDTQSNILLADNTHAALISFQLDGGEDDLLSDLFKSPYRSDIKVQQFYMKHETATYISNTYEIDESKSMYDRDVSIDIIDQPFVIKVCNEVDGVSFSLYERNELGINTNNPAISTKMFYDGRVIGSDDDEDTDTNVKKMHIFLMQVAVTMCQYIDENDWVYPDMKDEDGGVLVEVSNRKLKFRTLSEKDRPLLACLTLLGNIEMKRPYKNEIIDAWSSEMKSFEQNLEAAKSGDTYAMDVVAQAYLNGRETEQDPGQAVYWYRKMANKGDANAAYNLGLLYGKGFGVEKNLDKAMVCMECAWAFGDESAKEWSRVFDKAIKDTKLAESGNSEAQAELARFYMIMGSSLDQAGPMDDYDKCIYWARKAETSNEPESMWVLALAYEHGRGVSIDIGKAIKYYERGAELKHPGCLHSLGCYYSRGEIVKKDKKRAFSLFLESANLGYGLAMRDVGKCYQFAEGTTGNMKTAVEWYEKALEKIDDPELEKKTALFKMMSENEPNFGEDYPENNEDDRCNEIEYSDEDPSMVTECMSTVEDVEPSEHKNMSRVDAKNALNSGKGALKQIVKMPDGTEKEMAIWRGYELDGYDRTLNIFTSMRDLPKIIGAIKPDDADTEEILDPCDKEVGYQVTIDFTDLSGTMIFRKGREKVSVETYERDERRSYREIIEDMTGELDIETANVKLNDEDFYNAHSFTLYMRIANILRRYLLKKGIVQKLYDMFDETAGVIIDVSSGGFISTKIVKGLERPNLPCEVFLLGTQMRRPYIDEMLGLQSVVDRDGKTIKDQKHEKDYQQSEAKKAETRSKSQIEMEDVTKPLVYNELVYMGRPVQVHELVKSLDISSVKITAALTKLREEGKVVRLEDNGRAFYSI